MRARYAIDLSSALAHHACRSGSSGVIDLRPYQEITSFAQLIEPQLLLTEDGHAMLALGNGLVLESAARHTRLTASQFRF